MPRKPLVVHVVGARPNYMKIAPVYGALERRETVEQRLVHTGQHYDAVMKDVFFDELPLPRPHVELEIGSGSHAWQTGQAMIELEHVFLDVDLAPDLVVVAGDVNSTLAGALAAVKLELPICHVESGLRSFDWSMPEEHNRRLTDHVSTLLLTHSESANENLAREGIPNERVELVGNTMIDTLLENVDAARARAAWADYGLQPGEYVLVTLHRPNLVADFELAARTMLALEDVAARLPVVFPVHPRTDAATGVLDREKVIATAPLPYREFLSLQTEAAAVVTDSGGVQEETTILGVPCFTLRENTERPVTVTHGTNTVLGLDPDALRTIPDRLGEARAAGPPPLWDGRAGERAATAIERLLLPVREPARVACKNRGRSRRGGGAR